jgi:hypothetical protein
MKMDIITMDDLQQFKSEMLNELRVIMKSKSGAENKSWLKSNEVRKMLGISPGTLQNLRVNGTLSFRKVGGTIFYSREAIEEMMEGK